MRCLFKKYLFQVLCFQLIFIGLNRAKLAFIGWVFNEQNEVCFEFFY